MNRFCYSEVLDKHCYLLRIPKIDIFVSNFQDKVIIDTNTLNYIITLLEKIYANNLALLFIMSCLSSIYVCTHNRRKKDYVVLNNVEPKLLKGEIIEKV